MMCMRRSDSELPDEQPRSLCTLLADLLLGSLQVTAHSGPRTAAQPPAQQPLHSCNPPGHWYVRRRVPSPFPAAVVRCPPARPQNLVPASCVWVWSYGLREQLRADVVAGVTLAIMSIPQVPPLPADLCWCPFDLAQAVVVGGLCVPP